MRRSRKQRSWLRTRAFLMGHPGIAKMLKPAAMARRFLMRRHRTQFDSFFSDVISGELTVKIPAFRGTFTIDWRSDLLWDVLIYGDYEPELTKALTRHFDPGRDAVDVGANVGLYSVLFAALSSSESRVLAVEPAPAAVRHLRSNLAQNGADRVFVFEGVVAESPGRRTIHVIEGKEEYSSMERVLHSGFGDVEQQAIDVPAETLDGLVARHKLDPGFVKMDIEGAEYGALMGAQHLLKVHRPVFLIEVSAALLGRFSVDVDSLYAVLTDSGYELRNAVNPNAPIEDGGVILAIPASG